MYKRRYFITEMKGGRDITKNRDWGEWLVKTTESIKNKKGFTLIELIIVVTIIAILGAIIFFGIASTVKRSRAAADFENAKIIYSTLQRMKAEGTLPLPAAQQNFYCVTGAGTGAYPKTINPTTGQEDFVVVKNGGLPTAENIYLIEKKYLSSIPKISLYNNPTTAWRVEYKMDGTISVGVVPTRGPGNPPCYFLMPKQDAFSGAYSVLD